MMSTVTALALIASQHCVPPSVAPIMVGIGQHESGLQPYAVHDNTSGRSYFPDTAMQAVTISRSLLAIGHDLDLGIVQVNVRNFNWTGLSVETAFNACASFTAGAKILFAKYNGSPPDAMKAAYAVGVSREIAALDNNATGSASPRSSDMFTRPKSGRELIFVSSERK